MVAVQGVAVMTNLRAGVSAPLLTRERLLVGLPIVLSTLVSLGSALAFGLPTLGRISELKTQVVDLQVKKDSLPMLEGQLVKARADQTLLLDQQTILVDLIAGQDRIATFLALLEREARATGVTIERYEPLARPPAEPASTSGSQQSNDAAPTDPFEALGYRQSSVILGVQGAFEALQTFLQRMESLEVVVEASDLELDTPAATTDRPQRQTALGLRLSFLDRASPMEAESETDQTSASDQ